MRFEFNAQNVFNQKTTRHIFNQLNRGAGTANGSDAFLDLSDVNLFDGYNYQQMLQGLQSPTVSPFDPRYGMGDLFNPGFQGRIGVKFIF